MLQKVMLRMRYLLGLVLKLVTFGKKWLLLWNPNWTKVLESKVTFTINLIKFKISLNVSYKKYNFVVKESNIKSHSHHHLSCHYCCKKAIPFLNINLGNNWFLNVCFNGFPSETMFPLTLKDPIKFGYLSLLFDLVGWVFCLHEKNVVSW